MDKKNKTIIKFKSVGVLCMFHFLLLFFLVKERWSFLYLFKSSNTMLNRPKPSICWSYNNRFLQPLAIFWHWSIIHTLVHFFNESVAAKLLLVSMPIITTICFATETYSFCTSKLFFEETRFSLIMFLVDITASSGETIVSCIGK